MQASFFFRFVHYLKSLHVAGLMTVALSWFAFSVSGLAHILWLTVASGWNKERCIPETDTRGYTRLKALGFCCVCFTTCGYLLCDLQTFYCCSIKLLEHSFVYYSNHCTIILLQNIKIYIKMYNSCSYMFRFWLNHHQGDRSLRFAK